MPLTVLEIGAGHGGFTEPALAAGCSVVATEMSRPSLGHLRERFGTNDRFTATFDSDGSLDICEGEEFSLILCASVLHHIPDYLGFLEDAALRHLAADGSLVIFQDPLLYERVTVVDRLLTRTCYVLWRLAQGGLREGLRTQYRRLRRCYDEANPRDMVEYHTVRGGVDENAIVALLSERFERVSLLPYWSTQSSIGQRLGSVLRRTNTFAIVARGLKGDAEMSG